MKSDGLCKHIKNIVVFDPIVESEKEGLKNVGIELIAFDDVIKAGKGKDTAFTKCGALDSPLFSYTSGTTGDSKGVKLTHKNLIASCAEIGPIMRLNMEDSFISYLPYPHSFEQCCTFYAVMSGMKIGYF